MLLIIILRNSVVLVSPCQVECRNKPKRVESQTSLLYIKSVDMFRIKKRGG